MCLTGPHVFQTKEISATSKHHFSCTANSRELQTLLIVFSLPSSMTEHYSNNIYNAGM